MEKTIINYVSLKIVKENTIEVGGVNSPKIAAKVAIKSIGSKDREHLIVLSLDQKNCINASQIVSMGSLNSSLVHPREVFKFAVMSNSASIIIAHNHPSGNLKPSKQDILLTERLVECGKILGIELLDHLIVNSEEFISLKEKGVII